VEGESSCAMLFSLRLRSASIDLLLGGCRPLELTWISEKEPDDWRRRGRRLRGLAGTLCDVCVAPASPVLRASVGGVCWGTHSSDRSSSHGCVVLGIFGGWQRCGAGEGVNSAVVVRERVGGSATRAVCACWGRGDVNRGLGGVQRQRGVLAISIVGIQACGPIDSGPKRCAGDRRNDTVLYRCCDAVSTLHSQQKHDLARNRLSRGLEQA
jgi:hypothetical protein